MDAGGRQHLGAGELRRAQARPADAPHAHGPHGAAAARHAGAGDPFPRHRGGHALGLPRDAAGGEALQVSANLHARPIGRWGFPRPGGLAEDIAAGKLGHVGLHARLHPLQRIDCHEHARGRACRGCKRGLSRGEGGVASVLREEPDGRSLLGEWPGRRRGRGHLARGVSVHHQQPHGLPCLEARGRGCRRPRRPDRLHLRRGRGTHLHGLHGHGVAAPGQQHGHGEGLGGPPEVPYGTTGASGHELGDSAAAPGLAPAQEQPG
mmetsp:Transcript_59035/g.182948  ORF Transcript_59035/g.182948 Transcript_59035/m.182948 type:complete len:264 (-) Transcript_59035:325-1116(-)